MKRATIDRVATDTVAAGKRAVASGAQHAAASLARVEEFLNSITHGLGFLLSIPGLLLLLDAAGAHGTTTHVMAATVYGSTMVLMYAASSFYHSVSSPRWKDLLRMVDHIAIYFYIAGSYTPFLLLHVEGGFGWKMLTLVWGLALAGTVFKLFFTGRFFMLSTALYLGMGWLAVLAAQPLMAALPMAGLLWIAAGGAFYTVGVIFFVWERLPYNHAIWHLFVLAGSLCHYVAVLKYAL